MSVSVQTAPEQKSNAPEADSKKSKAIPSTAKRRLRGTYTELLLPVYLSPLLLFGKESACIYCISVTLVFLSGDLLPSTLAAFLPIVLLPVTGIMEPNELAAPYMNATVLSVTFFFILGIIGDETAAMEKLSALVLAAVAPSDVVAIFTTVVVERLTALIEEEFGDDRALSRPRTSRSSDTISDEGWLRRQRASRFNSSTSPLADVAIPDATVDHSHDHSELSCTISLVRQYKMHPDAHNDETTIDKPKSPRKTSFDPFERGSESGVWTPSLPARRIHSHGIETDTKPVPILKSPQLSPKPATSDTASVCLPDGTMSPTSFGLVSPPRSASISPSVHISSIDEPCATGKTYGTSLVLRSQSYRRSLTLSRGSRMTLITPHRRQGSAGNLDRPQAALSAATSLRGAHHTEESVGSIDSRTMAETSDTLQGSQPQNNRRFLHLNIRRGYKLLRLIQHEQERILGDRPDKNERSQMTDDDVRHHSKQTTNHRKHRGYALLARKIFMASRTPVRSLLSGGKAHDDCRCISKGITEHQPASTKGQKVIALSRSVRPAFIMGAAFATVCGSLANFSDVPSRNAVLNNLMESKPAVNVTAMSWIAVAIPVVIGGFLPCWAYVYWHHLQPYNQVLDECVQQQISKCAKVRLRDCVNRRLEEIVIMYWMLWFPFSYTVYAVRSTHLQYVEWMLLLLTVLAMSIIPKNNWKFVSRYRVLSWEVVKLRLPWNVIFSLGSASLLAHLAEKYKLVQKLFNKISKTIWLHKSPYLGQALLTTIAACLAEVISSNSLAELLVPSAIEAATLSQVHPVVYVVPVGLASCTNVLMPVTLPLLILREYIHLPWIHVLCYGLLLKLIIISLIVISMDTIGMLVFHVDMTQKKSEDHYLNITLV
ncbi:uncharacterized protein LOC135370381 isoform X2 [Ornithodoros turicata]|uniref:uncharacterized protein LOC135370381 isoform X2 n=1 Tax=Ornithodoros turicata TaxID=34597 RepID=UPI00313909A3